MSDIDCILATCFPSLERFMPSMPCFRHHYRLSIVAAQQSHRGFARFLASVIVRFNTVQVKIAFARLAKGFPFHAGCHLTPACDRAPIGAAASRIFESYS
jgi:hypothetical protein